jgi:hypothetical protein
MRAFSRPIVFTLSLGILLLLALRFYDHTVDDAFIGFRYAQNLVEGNGLVFNAGERVEGYTNFLWVLLVAPFLAFGADPELVARIFGLVSSAALLAIVVRFSPRPQAAPELVWVAPLLLATSPPVAVWATAGMETPLFACLLTWSVALACDAVGRDRLSPSSALVVAAAALTRPEGCGVAVVLATLLLFLRRHRPRAIREVGVWCVAFLVLYLPYFVWRVAYYGDLLPNTFHAKVGSDPFQAVRGLLYVDAYLVDSGYWLLVPLVGLLWSKHRDAIAIAGSLVVALVGYVIVVGGDGLPMYRFLVPLLPLFFLLIALGVVGIVKRLGGRRAVRVAAATVVAGMCVGAALPAFRGSSARYVEQDRREVSAWREVGKYFADNAPADASIAVLPAGAIPYFSGLKTIDMLGLTDRTIARRRIPALGRGQAGHEKHHVDYVLSRQPTYVLIGVYGLASNPQPARQLLQPFYPAETEMLRSHQFRSRYVLRRARAASGYFAYFERAADE